MAIAMAATALSGRLSQNDTAVGVRPMDEQRFGGIYEATARPIRAYLAGSLGDPSLADDLTQECFVRLIRSGFDTDDPAHMRNYLFRIATNLMRDHWRRHRPTVEATENTDAESGPETEVVTRTDVQRGLAQLSPTDRQMLWLAYVEGCTHQEIASQLGLRATSLKSMLFRARSRLAAIFRQDGASDSRQRTEDVVLGRKPK